MTIPVGTKVRVKQNLTGRIGADPHRHALLRDVGEASDPEPHHPHMARLYTIVRFPGCPAYHRFLESELEVVAG